MPSTPKPIMIDLQIVAPQQAPVGNTSLRDYCIALPQPKQDVRGEKGKDLVPLMINILLGGGAEVEGTPNST